MDFFDESINSTQKSFNFLENVKNADQTFNETNDSDKILESVNIPSALKTERVPTRNLRWWNERNREATAGNPILVGAHLNI